MIQVTATQTPVTVTQSGDGVQVAVAADVPVDLITVNVPGPQGPETDLSDVLRISARLGEFDTAQAKTEARQNLELQNIDCGTFN